MSQKWLVLSHWRHKFGVLGKMLSQVQASRSAARGSYGSAGSRLCLPTFISHLFCDFVECASCCQLVYRFFQVLQASGQACCRVQCPIVLRRLMSHPNVWRRLTMLWKLFEVTPAYSARGYRLRHGFLSVSWQSCDPHCLVRPNLTGFDSSVHASWQLEKR